MCSLSFDPNSISLNCNHFINGKQVSGGEDKIAVIRPSDGVQPFQTGTKLDATETAHVEHFTGNLLSKQDEVRLVIKATPLD